MPQRSAVTQLPEEIREELNQRLVTSCFSDYQGLAEWLAEQGYEISRSAVHRYGQQFEERLAQIKVATEQAKAIASVVGDEEGAMNDALIRLVQERAFDVLIRLQDEDPEEFSKIFPKMGVMVARLSRASVQQKKWQAEARKKAEKALATIEKKTAKNSLDPETMRIIKEEIYGIF